MTFKTIHSLGSRCQNSEILKFYGYREFSGFFDFMNTSTVNIINHILENDFLELLKDENNFSLVCEQLTIDPETGERLPSSIRTNNKFYNHDYLDVHSAIFPHHDLNDEKTKNHFLNCRQRLKKLKHYPTLFNYTFNKWENNIHTGDMDRMANSLINVYEMKDFRLCFIGVEYGVKSTYDKVASSQYYDVWNLTIPSHSFTGGLFQNQIDNENYINIIKSYDIDSNRVTREEIDSLPQID